MKNNVVCHIVASDLCCGCGGCVGVCPTQALNIDSRNAYTPEVVDDKCCECELCLKVCPGKGYPVTRMANKQISTRIKMSEDVGPVLNCYIGHSIDSEIRAKSSSGGVATSLLLHLLENGQVDIVSVVAMKDERPVALLTNNPEEIKSAVKSKYGPVPLLMSLIPALMDKPQRVAATFTPCQLAGLRLAIEQIPKLRESSIIAVGLFCGYVQKYEVITAIAKSMGVMYPQDTSFIGWRCGAYPGVMRFKKNDGSFMDKPKNEWSDIAIPFFSLRRCFLCPDGGNWLADLTLGDVHSYGNDETIVVCRTNKGMEILDSATKSGKINLEIASSTIVKKCAIKAITRSKLRPANVVIKWLNNRNVTVPVFDYDSEKLLTGFYRYLSALWIFRYRLIYLVRDGRMFTFLANHPVLLEKTGHFLYYFPTTIPGYYIIIKIVKLCNKWLKLK